MLQRWMLLMDVDIIMQTPLRHRRHADLWARHYECKGIFSTRSAYQMLIFTKEKMEAWLEGRTSNSNVGAEEKQWCSLWKTHVPCKIKMFLWRQGMMFVIIGGWRRTTDARIAGQQTHGGML
jgi:hypothetical protein